MRSTVLLSLGVLLAAGITVGCARDVTPADPSSTPSLDITSASGVTASVRRSVTTVSAGVTESAGVVDTTVWAPFDADGWAQVSSNDAGTPGPVGALTRPEFTGRDMSRYSNFVDDDGVLHELSVIADAPGPPTAIVYKRGHQVVFEQRSSWNAVNGGWVLHSETATYHLSNGAALQIGVDALGMQVARAGFPGLNLARAGAALTGLLAPRPLAAQMFFRECAKEWLVWMGAAMLAEYYWAKFSQSKNPLDFKRAMSASAAAGGVLTGLVDCMLEHGDVLDPGD